MISLNELSPYELGLTYDKEAIPILIKYLESGKPNERRLSASAIGKLLEYFPNECKKSIPALLNCLQQKNQPQTIQYSLKTLSKFELTQADFDNIKNVIESDTHAYNIKLAKSILKKSTDKTVSKEISSNAIVNGEETINTFEDYTIKNKYPAHYRTIDGHYVRSRAEVIIDNWFFIHGIAHAYEKQVPVSENLFCDFYLLQGKIYIEYWGLTSNSQYVSRKEKKKKIYKKYGLNLIELTEKQLHDLDAFLPKLLLKYNVKIV